jgi:BACON domain-containing protein/all-beta uncharacterized protein
MSKQPLFRIAILVVVAYCAALFPQTTRRVLAAPPLQWQSRGPGGGGALFAPSFAPWNPSELYVACDMSELFHSTNLGVSWDPVNFKQIQGNRNSQVRFTSASTTAYALDASSIGGADSTTPSKTTDGGATWARLPADPTGGGAYSLFADGNGLNNLIVSDYDNIYFSSDGGTSFGLAFAGSGCYVAGALFDSSNIFIGTSAGLLKSTNGGTSFTLAGLGGIPATETMVSFAGAKQGATTRLYCITMDPADVFPGLTIEGVYSSYKNVYSIDWGQANWTLRTSGIAANEYPAFVATATNNTSIAYLAGQDINDFPILYKTTNGGGSWQKVLFTTNNQNVITGWAGDGGDRGWTYGAGALGLAASPNDPNKVAYTDLGFVYLSTNGGTTWQQAYLNPADQNPANSLSPKNRAYHGNGLENTSCWWVTWADANNIFAGYSDIKGTRSTDGGSSWSFNYTGHPLNTAYQGVKHPSTGTLYIATSSVHDMYQSTHLTDSSINGGTGAVRFSTDKGATWNTLHDFGHPVIWVALDPNNANRMYASVIHSTAGGIFVSNNIQNGSASTWTKLTNPPRTEGHPFNICVLNDGALVCTYSGRRTTAFTASSGVFLSTDGGTTWLDRSSNPGMYYWTKDIVIDPFDPSQNTWYVGVFSGWGGPPNGLGGLYRTVNRGQSWTRINSLDRVGSCAISPNNHDELYLTTETDGLWYTSNLTAASPTWAQLTSYPFRQPERVFFNPYNSNEVWVGSFGHGLRVGSTCSFSAAPLENFSPMNGTAASVSITTPASCPWNAVSNDGWIQITSSASGTGNSSVNYVVSANWTSAARRGTVTVAGQTLTIVQDGGVSADCSYILSPASKSFSPAGGMGSISVFSQERCAWQATTTDTWLHITSLSCGIGNGAVTYSVDPRVGGSSRTGKIKIAGQVYTVKQK